MIARKMNIPILPLIQRLGPWLLLLPLRRRLDRWLLLRAPMLWRTRLPHLLVRLSLAVAVIIPFIQTSANVPYEAYDLGRDIKGMRSLLLIVAVVVLGAWVALIHRIPVGELAPHRHVVTVVAVAIGSYLCLITPSLLAYPKISAIGRVGVSDQQLET